MMALSVGEREMPVIFSYLSEFDKGGAAAGFAVAAGGLSGGCGDDAIEEDSGGANADRTGATGCATGPPGYGVSFHAQDAAQARLSPTMSPRRSGGLTSVLKEMANCTPDPSPRALQS